MTAFVVPMDLPGIEIRPIRQMSGGASFNEVFFTDVRVRDSMRLGAEGDGWRVALTTLGFERDHSDGSGGGRVGGGWQQLSATARAMGATADPATRRALADAYIGDRVETFVNRRAAELARGGTPGPEGSLGKLHLDRGDAAHVGRHLPRPRAGAGRRHRRVGHVRVGRARARRARATASPAAPTRCSATSSPSACSAAGRTTASTRTSPFKDVPTMTARGGASMRDDETFQHRDRCAISGIGWTDFSRDSGRSELTLATQASLAAIADAGLTPQDIDGIVRCDMDLVRSNDLVDALGMTRLDYYGDAGPGGVAPTAQVAQAMAAVISGLATNVLVYRSLNGRSGRRFGLSSVTSAQVGGNGTYDEFFLPYGLLTPGQIFGLIAQRHMLEYGTTRRTSGRSPSPAATGPTRTRGPRCTTARCRWTTTSRRA